MKKTLIIANLCGAMLILPLLATARQFHIFNITRRYSLFARSLQVDSQKADLFLKEQTANLHGNEYWRVTTWLYGTDCRIGLVGLPAIGIFVLNIIVLARLEKVKKQGHEASQSSHPSS
jgi:hypothetical protein